MDTIRRPSGAERLAAARGTRGQTDRFVVDLVEPASGHRRRPARRKRGRATPWEERPVVAPPVRLVLLFLLPLAALMLWGLLAA